LKAQKVNVGSIQILLKSKVIPSNFKNTVQGQKVKNKNKKPSK